MNCEKQKTTNKQRIVKNKKQRMKRQIVYKQIDSRKNEQIDNKNKTKKRWKQWSLINHFLISVDVLFSTLIKCIWLKKIYQFTFFDCFVYLTFVIFFSSSSVVVVVVVVVVVFRNLYFLFLLRFLRIVCLMRVMKE